MNWVTWISDLAVKLGMSSPRTAKSPSGLLVFQGSYREAYLIVPGGLTKSSRLAEMAL